VHEMCYEQKVLNSRELHIVSVLISTFIIGRWKSQGRCG